IVSLDLPTKSLLWKFGGAATQKTPARLLAARRQSAAIKSVRPSRHHDPCSGTGRAICHPRKQGPRAAREKPLVSADRNFVESISNYLTSHNIVTFLIFCATVSAWEIQQEFAGTS